MPRNEIDPVERRAVQLCRLLSERPRPRAEALTLLAQINRPLPGDGRHRNSVVRDLDAVIDLALAHGWLTLLDGRLSVTPTGKAKGMRSRAGFGKRDRVL
jgi:hypothetical protein